MLSINHIFTTRFLSNNNRFNITHVAHAIFTFIWMRQLHTKLRIDALASVWCTVAEMTAPSQAICSVAPWSCFAPILYLSLTRGASEAHLEACLSHFRLLLLSGARPQQQLGLLLLSGCRPQDAPRGSKMITRRPEDAPR